MSESEKIRDTSPVANSQMSAHIENADILAWSGRVTKRVPKTNTVNARNASFISFAGRPLN